MNDNGVSSPKPLEPESRKSVQSTEGLNNKQDDEDEITGNQLEKLGEMGGSVVSFEKN